MPTWGSDGTSPHHNPNDHNAKGWAPSRRGLIGLMVGAALVGVAGIAAGIAVFADASPSPSQPAAGGAGDPATTAPAGPGNDVQAEVPWPWAAIGRVTLASGDYCTGTLIAPDLVLTAAHCVTAAPGQPAMRPERIMFEAGYRNGTRTALGHVAGVLRPDRNALAQNEDIALLRLTEPLPVRPLPLLPDGTPPKGRGLSGHGMMAGYGAPHPQRLAVESNCLVLGLPGAVLARHTCTSTNGSSGSPILWGMSTTKDGRITDIDQARVAGLSIGYVADGSSPAGVLVTAPALRDFVASVPVAAK